MNVTSIIISRLTKWTWVALWISASQGQDLKHVYTGEDNCLPLNLEMCRSLVQAN